MSIRFEDLGLSKEVLKSVQDMGFEETSPIQELAIPFLLEGRDVIGQAQTGTGKTAAFGIPILERIDLRSKSTQAIVLCPTRELAIQVAEELVKLAAHKRGLFVLPVYGGQPIDRQFRGLARGAQVVVGTPGRVMDHMERGTLKLETVNMAVLDEADEMLDMGFRDDIEAILEKTPDACQTIFFSATMAPAIMDLSRRYLNNPELVKVTQKMLTVPNIEQVYFEVRPHQKMDALCRLLDSQGYRKALVFCSTKRSVDEVTVHLQARGYQSDGLHGNLAQAQRDRVMNRFRTGGIEILVATDVAARGIDVDDVDAVVNFDIPNDVENYVHRIGRTGRAGRSGSAFTFVTPRENYKLRDIIRYTKAVIVQNQLPTLRDVTNIKTTRLLTEVRAAIEEGSLERYSALVEQFLDEEMTSMDMASALLKLLMQRDFGQPDLQQEDTLNQPDRGRGDRGRNDRGDRGRNDRGDRAPRERGDRAPRERGDRPDRGNKERGDRGDRFGGRNRAAMTRLFFNIGSKMQVQPRDLVGAIAGESGIPGRSIGAIEIHDKFCFVEIPSDVADEVITVMNESQIRGFRVAVEKAVPKS